MRASPTLAASIGLVILAVAAPVRAHAEALAPDTVQATSRLPEDPPAHSDTTRDNQLADCCHFDRDDRDRYARWRLSSGVGIRFGSFTVNGHSTGAAIPFHVDLGFRSRRTFLFGSYDVFSIHASVPAFDPLTTTARNSTITQLGDGSGLVHRLGANARYTLARFGEHDGGFDLWTEAGIGVQHVRWDAGGIWTRPDLALGLGATMLYLGKYQHAGFSIGLRVMLAPRNDTAGAPAMCGGPCDEATPPSRVDRSFMFDMTLPFGW